MADHSPPTTDHPRVVLLSREHRLAGRQSVTLYPRARIQPAPDRFPSNDDWGEKTSRELRIAVC